MSFNYSRFTSLVILILFIIRANLLVGQCPNRVIHQIELEQGHDSGLEIPKVKNGDFVQFKVKGFNPLLYNVLINQKDTSTSKIDIPVIFSTLPKFEFSELISSVLKSDITDGTTELKTAVMTTFGLGGDKKMSSNWASFQLDSSNCDSNLIKVCEIIDPDIQSKMTDLIKSNSKFKGGVCSLFSQFLKDIKTSQSLKREYERAQKYLYEVEKYFHLWGTGTYALDSGFDFLEFNSTIIELRNDQTISESIYKNLLKDHGELKPPSTEPQKSSFLSRQKEFMEFSKLCTNYNKIISKTLTKIDSVFTIDEIVKINSAIQNFSNYQEYFSLPLQITDDLKKVSISIQPYNLSSNIPRYNTSIQIKRKNAIKFGINGGFYLGNMRNQSFSTIVKDTSIINAVRSDTTDVKFYSPIAEDLSSLDIGINALIFAAVNITRNELIKLQLSIGPTLAFRQPFLPGLALGGGFLFGDKNNVSLTFGVNWGYAQKLSNAFAVGEYVSDRPESFTVDQLKRSGFISIGYNFLKF